MIVITILIAAVVTLFVLLAVDFIYFDVPSYVPSKMDWRFRLSGFWQRVNWIFAGVVFGIVLIGFLFAFYERELKKWFRGKAVI